VGDGAIQLPQFQVRLAPIGPVQSELGVQVNGPRVVSDRLVQVIQLLADPAPAGPGLCQPGVQLNGPVVVGEGLRPPSARATARAWLIAAMARSDCPWAK